MKLNSLRAFSVSIPDELYEYESMMRSPPTIIDVVCHCRPGAFKTDDDTGSKPSTHCPWTHLSMTSYKSYAEKMSVSDKLRLPKKLQ